ncbi:D-amino acid dehydrogenase [Niveispirillum cyanobacteriorum]|uniref:D-amino acid dehydrogenase n=1 Tax=Niveispirillum cyanobacteriorum TaxID=1612173 RepID=A0A2K9NDF7_9PROT|nr:D-amino acid dehydrogenase [Niveispirillum cyanobacteriorum]AUN31158.1 D-amino acid dehydrogenase [Niveispirillum cyanobacteriorum]GGE88656.1 D-amino acid dehydrogenase [Niveispirillum cyanobacteriorum]
MTRIAVIGAGITGVTTAYKLQDSGADITLYDRHPYPAMETSYANGGQLSASNAEVWTHWGQVLKGLKWMLRADAPLLFNPKPSLHKYGWVAQFLAAIPRYQQNTVATVRMAIAARQHLLEMADEEGIDFDLERRGILHVYRDPAGLHHATAVNNILRSGGLDRQPVSPLEIIAIEPSLQGRFEGGFYTPSDFTGDVHKYTNGLASAVARRGGQLRMNTTVTDIRVRQGRVEVASRDDHQESQDPFDAVVICAGVGSRSLANWLGDDVNVYPVKGYSITVNLNDEESRKAAPRVSLLDDGAKIVTSRLGDGRFRIAGTAEFNGENRDIRADRIAPLLGWCRALFPRVSTRDFIPWAGLRPMMPDMMPRVGSGRLPGVYYNTGHGHLGWTLAALTATLTASMVASAHGTKPRAL